MKRLQALILAITFATAMLAQAAHAGLTIHAAEMGIGKFHRQDNKVHAYASDNIWKNYVLPDGVNEKQQLVQKNADGSYTIFFTNLEEMLNGVVAVSTKENQKVSILNLEAHGMPGAMWYPKSAEQRDSMECNDWRSAAYGDDVGNYNQYYSPVDKFTIMYYRSYAQRPEHGHQACTSGLAEWAEIANGVKGFDTVFADNAEMHFISCIVGLGNAGDAFTKGIAQVLFKNVKGKALTSLYFGLGDWSLPEGMGFWDYVSDSQLQRDNDDYVKNKSDRNIAMKGSVRLATSEGSIATTSVYDQVMFVNVNQTFNTNSGVPAMTESYNELSTQDYVKLPARIRIPGTNAYINGNK